MMRMAIANFTALKNFGWQWFVACAAAKLFEILLDGFAGWVAIP